MSTNVKRLKYIVYSLLKDFCRNKKAPPIIASEEKEKELNIYRLNPAPPKRDDLQECVAGIYKALQSYNKAENGQFIKYKVRIMWNEVHNYLRILRSGFSDNSETSYRNLRKIMYLYYQYGNTDDAISEIAEKVNRSEEYVSKMLQAGMRNTSLVDFYVKYADDEEEETLTDLTVDYTTKNIRKRYICNLNILSHTKTLMISSKLCILMVKV